MKLQTNIHATYNVEPGFSAVKFPYSTIMLKVMKKYPGCRWHDPRHAWLVPNELVGPIQAFAKKELGWTPICDMSVKLLDKAPEVNPAAFKYQKEDILKALQLRRAMLAWEMGLGKTLGGIEFIRLSECARILVVCPAMARGVWEADLARWWPDHPPTLCIRDGKQAASFASQAGDGAFICITSYELLKKLSLPARLECVIADESHYVKEPKVGRSKALRDILTKWDVPYRLFLTGTPITVQPIDMHNQGDLLYPGRLGNYYAFGDSYCGRVDNGYRYRGFDYAGVNNMRAEELYQRLGSFIFRRTKDEVKDQLPNLLTRTIRLQADRSIVRKIDESLKRNESIDDLLAMAGNQKIDPIVKMLEEDFASGATHVNVSTYFQLTAQEFAGRLEDAIGKWEGNRPIVFHIDGNTPEKKRQTIVAEAKRNPFSILVSTMKAVNVGINLTKFSPSYCAELYSAPGIMGQWAGRFHRVGSDSDKPEIRFVVLEGTEEEAIAATLERRMKEHGKIVAKGHIDNAIIHAFEEKTETPGEFLKRIRAAVANSREEDVYA